MRSLAVLGLLLVSAAPVAAQGEEQLRDAFEGKTVVVKIDMPASSRGVNIKPQERRPMDAQEYAERIKDYGTSLKAGTSVMVTKIRVKKDLIEFQLGGGGYGTFGDDRGDVYVPTSSKSTREKNLEKDLKTEKDAARKKEMQEELDKLRRERDSQDALVKATTAAAEAANKERVQQKALAAGSRFNVRYKPALPPEALTAEGLRAALAEYVDFGGGAAVSPAAAAAPAAPARPTALRKGLTVAEVEALLGKPTSSNPRVENGLHLLSATYTQGESTVTAEFVEGVLVRYSISSN